MVPSFTRWAAGECSRMAQRMFSVPVMLFTWVDDTTALVDHGERRRGLLTEMDNGIGLEVAQHVADKVEFAQIADEERYLAAGDLFPSAHPVAESADRDEGLGVEFKFPTALGEIVENRNFMITRGKIHGGRPAQIAVPT